MDEPLMVPGCSRNYYWSHVKEGTAGRRYNGMKGRRDEGMKGEENL